MDDALRQLRAIIRQKSLRIGEFTLSSGKRSSYYLDCRMTTLDPTGALLIGRLMLDCIRKRNIQADAIGGFRIGVGAGATAIAVVSVLEGLDPSGVIFFTVKHGLGKPMISAGRYAVHSYRREG